MSDSMSQVPQSLPLPAAGATSSFKNLGANVTLNIKSTPGRVFSIKCHNNNGLDRYFQLHNTATVPSSGDAPKFVVLVPALSDVIVGTDYFCPDGISFSTGIAFAFSTTETTYTAGVAGDQVTFVEYA